jgi:energy-coupling factor transport system permease protein
MLQNITLGVYNPGNSLLHRLQARTKFLLVIWLTICVFIANHHQWHFAPYIVLVVLALIGIVLSGISPGQIWRRLRLLLLLMVLGAIPSLFATDSTFHIIYAFGPYNVSYAQLHWLVAAYGIVLVLYLVLHLLPIPSLRYSLNKGWVKRIRLPFVLLTLLALGILLFTSTMPAYSTFPIGPFLITDEGVWSLISFYTVLVILYIFALLLITTTTSIALIEGLTALLAPLRWLRLPVDDFALMVLIALRFIPTLIDEVEQLIKAQMSRGADYTHGSLRERVQSMIALFVPLMQGILRRAEELATALEARGYATEGKQTRLHETSFHQVDYATLAVVALVTIGALLL